VGIPYRSFSWNDREKVLGTVISGVSIGNREIGGHNTYFSLLGPSAKAFLAQHVCDRIFILVTHKENDVARAMSDET